MLDARRILVGFDGSASSRRALDYAEQLARCNHGRLSIVYVLAHHCYPTCWPAPVVPPTADELERCAASLLRRAIEALATDLSVTSTIVHGRVGPALLRESQRHDYDAIAIGRGHRPLQPWPSAVERYLRRHVSVPMIVVPLGTPDALVQAAREPAAPRITAVRVRPA